MKGRADLRRSTVMVAALVALATCPAVSAAQSSLQIPLQFDFLNPGAKSLALAGAFSGLADDATATFANPAGLTQLDRTEVSFEARLSRTRTKFLQRGRLSGPVSNEGVDTIAGPVFGDSMNSNFGPGFISFVYVPKRRLPPPDVIDLRPPRIWVIAAYRHELVRVDQSFLAEGVFQMDPSELTSRRDTAQQGLREVSITAYGASAAYRLHPGLSIGASLTVYDFHLNSEFRRDGFVDGFFGPPNLNLQLGVGTQAGDSVSVEPTVGLQWARQNARLGVVYRHGASFDFTTTSGEDPPTASTFRVPDTLAFGAAWRARPTLTVATEVTYVSYSRIREDFVTDQALASHREDSFDIDDGVEVHGGVQLTRPAWRFLPRFRAGLWFDPDHSVHFTPTGTSATPLDRLFDERLATALSTGKNQVHYTAGVGLTFTPRLELNVGFDVGSTTHLFSTSIIVR